MTSTYEKENDQRLPSFVKTTKRCDQNKGLDTDNTRNIAAIDKRVKEKNDKIENERAAAAADASLQTVCKDSKDTKTLNKASNSIKNNSDSQTTETNVGRMRCAGGLGCFSSNSNDNTSFLDATTACYNCNNNSKCYFCSAISKILSIFDSRDYTCHLHKCISLA